MVLDFACDNVISLALVGFRRGLDGPVVGLGSSCRKIYLIALRPKGVSNGLACVGNRLLARG